MSRHVLNLDGDQVHALHSLLQHLDKAAHGAAIYEWEMRIVKLRTTEPMQQLAAKVRRAEASAIEQLNERTHPQRRERRLQPKDCREHGNQTCSTCPDDVCCDNTTEPELQAKLAAEVLAREPMSADEQTTSFAAAGLTPTAKGLAAYGNAKRERVDELEAERDHERALHHAAVEAQGEAEEDLAAVETALTGIQTGNRLGRRVWKVVHHKAKLVAQVDAALLLSNEMWAQCRHGNASCCEQNTEKWVEALDAAIGEEPKT